MEKVIITCPFTGLEFEALKYADGRLVATNQLTGEDIHITYNSSIKKYMLDAKHLKHVPMVTMEECAEALGVSKPRVSALIKNGRLDTVKLTAKLYITKDSMLVYKQQQDKRLRESKVHDGTGTN